MKMTIEHIVTLNRRGKRAYNEDSIFPEENLITESDRLFMVCDGVGGRPGGGQASQIVCKHFSDYMAQFGAAFQNREMLTKALRYTEEHLDEYIRIYPEHEGMATTMTYLFLNDFGAVAAWIGDSRIYQFRAGRIVRQSRDHSLVNALLDYGEITEAEAANHPKKHVVLRALSGSANPAKLDVMFIDDIMSGDYFLLCTDGLQEGASNETLIKLLGGSYSAEEIKEEIDALCTENAQDNYSMILVKIGDLEAPPLEAEEIDPKQSALAATPKSASVEGPEDTVSTKKSILSRWPLLFVLAAILIVFLLESRDSPAKLKMTAIRPAGLMIEDEQYKILIDALPLSNRIQLQEDLAPVRSRMTSGAPPYEGVDYFLLSHRSDIDSEEAKAFIGAFMENNEGVRLYPQTLLRQLRSDGDLFESFQWHSRELDTEAQKLFHLLQNSSSANPNEAFTAFIIRLQEKNILYAGDPDFDPAALEIIAENIDYALINEWSLRSDSGRQAISDRLDDRKLLILPSSRPMNNREKQNIKDVFPKARFFKDFRRPATF